MISIQFRWLASVTSPGIALVNFRYAETSEAIGAAVLSGTEVATPAEVQVSACPGTEACSDPVAGSYAAVTVPCDVPSDARRV